VSDYTDNTDVTPLFNAQVCVNIYSHTQHIALQSHITWRHFRPWMWGIVWPLYKNTKMYMETLCT